MRTQIQGSFPLTVTLFLYPPWVQEWITYLAKDKCIEYHSVLHLSWILYIVKMKNTLAPEVENKKNTNLIQGLQWQVYRYNRTEIYYSFRGAIFQ